MVSVLEVRHLTLWKTVELNRKMKYLILTVCLIFFSGNSIGQTHTVKTFHDSVKVSFGKETRTFRKNGKKISTPQK